MLSPEDEDEDSVWSQIERGDRDPLRIVYAAIDVDDDDLDISELTEWGDLTGYWGIDLVRSFDEALAACGEIQPDFVVILGGWTDEAERMAAAHPHIPISMANTGGFDFFDFDRFPPQVITAQWMAPRAGEFMEVVEDLMSKFTTDRIYAAGIPNIELVRGVSDRLLAHLSRFPNDRFQIKPRLFEETVAELLERMGYRVHLTPWSGDKGRDIIAAIDTPTAPVLMLVQCKRYAANRRVGPEPITRLWTRLFDDKANLAMVVTTSSFEPVAYETASTRGYQVSLKDGEDFLEWVGKYRR
jgi:hypothetical protein